MVTTTLICNKHQMQCDSIMNPSSKLRYVSCLLDSGESSDVEDDHHRIHGT
jgi:hypothetical protein